MYFRDRNEAAELLADKLLPFRGVRPLVLAIPRGSVPMGKTLADHLGADFDVVLVHKIGAPGNPEFAVGSVSEFGTIYRSEAARLYGIPSHYIDDSALEEIQRLRDRRQSYSPTRPPVSPKGRTVIIVDDGIATGSTMLAAIRAIRSQGPKRIIVAAPVAPPSSVETLRGEADKVIVLDTPEDFYSVGQFYEDFPQIDDEEVLRVLSESTGPKRSQARRAA